MEIIRRFWFRGKLEIAFASFICDVLGGKIMKSDPERDSVRLGENFYIGSLYGDVH